jgi:hypothetical protein
MPDGEGTLRMTYAQLAEARGISKASAERLVRNRKWLRLLGNDGVAIVIVPPGEASPESSAGSWGGSGGGKPERRRRDRRPGKPPLDHGVDPSPDFRGIIEAAVAPIREQLIQADRDAARLRVELIDLLISERSAVDLAEYASTEVADLRRRLDTAEEERRRLAGQQEIERDRADRIEQQLTKVEGELIAARVEAASLQCQLELVRPKAVPDSPRSGWRRLLAWRK